jgi:probable O-glycosylation ligase (exosortase A-associated)
MGYRRQPSDYDPVAPARRPLSEQATTAPDAPLEDTWLAHRRARSEITNASSLDAAADSFPANKASAQPSDTNSTGDPVSVPSSAPRSAKWTHTRGHALTFAGLFLFTVVLYLRPYELFDALAGFTSMAFGIAVCTLAVFFPTQLSLEGNLTARPREVNLVLLLCLAGALSIPLAQDPARSWSAFVDLLKVALMFVVMVNAVRTERRLKILLLLALAVSCALSVAAISDYQAGKLVMRGTRIAGTIKGLFDNPNDLALHLVTMIPIAAALMFSARSLIKKMLYGACALAMVGGTVVTFSRGGFLALVAASLVLLWKIGRRHRLAIGALALVVVAFFIALAPTSYGGRLSTTSDDSVITRQDDLKRSIIVSLRHPLFGIGMDNYVLYSNTEHATHNAYTQVSAEMGFAALVIYVMFIVAPFKRLRRIERETSGAARPNRFYYLAIGLQASLVGYMVSSFFASVAYVWYIYYLVSYAVCLHRVYEASPEALKETIAGDEDLKGKDALAAHGRVAPLRESEALDA